MREFFKRRAPRVVGVVVLGAVVVAILFILLNWYVAPTKPSDRKDLVLALAQILGGTALLSGLYFTWRTLQVNREGQITDRFTRAIDQLGKVDENGNKLFEIRVGGIYALERIARESEEDYWPIMEILTAYVRQNAPWPPEEGQGRGEDATEQSALEDTGGKSETTEAPAPNPDIQAIMTVLRRRALSYEHGESEPLDLHATNLSDADLSGAFLQRVLLSRANLAGAIFFGANLAGANLTHANLVQAKLAAKSFARTNLAGANLSDTYLSMHANFYEAHLHGAHLHGADLYGAQSLTEEQLEQAEGDEDTQLPPDLKPPERWGVKSEEHPEED